MVGAKGFEPSTSWSRTRRASQAALRPDGHAPPHHRPERKQELTTASASHPYRQDQGFPPIESIKQHSASLRSAEPILND